MVNTKKLVITVCGVLSYIAVAIATPVLNTPETWGTGGNLDTWTATAPGNPTAPNSGGAGNNSGYLQVELPDQGTPYSVQVYTPSGSAATIAGNQNYNNSDLYAVFNFRYETTAPNSLALYFYSATSGREWVSAFNTGSLVQNQWTQFSQTFAYGANWSLIGGGGTLSDFIADAQDVDRVGISVSGDWMVPGSQFVGLDDFEIRIPEPESIFLIIASILFTGISFRSRVMGFFSKAKGMISKV